MSDENEIISNVTPYLYGPIFAFVMTILRAIYYRKKPAIRILIEACIMACVTVSVMAAAIIALPISDHQALDIAFLSAGIGSFVGFLGIEHTRRLAIKHLNIKIGKD